MSRVPWMVALATACATAPPDKSVEAVDSGQPDTIEPEVPDTLDPDPDDPTDPWPDPATLPEGTVSVVYDGAVVPSGETVSIDTPPAGLPDPTRLRFVLTNRTDTTLALPSDPSAWMDSDAFTWSTPPPTSLAPEESASLELVVDVSEETAATVHTATLAIPDGPTVYLEAHVPRPLRIVVVGSGHYSAVSDSYGAAFETEQNPDDGAGARDVVWGNGRFLRADQEWADWFAPGVYQWSDDGLTWHDSASSDDFWVSDCAHAWDRFYCVRSASWTSSDDGAVVLHDSNGWGDLLNGVVLVPGDEVGRGADDTDPDALFSGDRLVAVGRNGSRRLSADGASWTADVTSSTTSTYYNAVAYGNGLVVAVGGYNSLEVAVSADGGETWTETVLADETYASFYTVVYGNGVFLAGANSNANDQLWRSTDGITWEGLGRDRQYPLTFSNGWFLAVRQPWGQPATLSRSTDGIVWDEVHVTPDGVQIQAAATERWEAP
jgi:hypothetical protein